MSKQITPAELAEIVTLLLTDPEGSGELATEDAFQSFMTSIATVVCDHCGGEVHNPASPIDGDWLVGIHGNDSLPESSDGIWNGYDPEGQLQDQDEQQCSRCQAPCDSVTGTPGGEELCSDCFDAGDQPAQDGQQQSTDVTPKGFVEQVANLRMWSYDSDLKTHQERSNVDEDGDEINGPADGFLDSHCTLMDLIELARCIRVVEPIMQ